MLYNALQISPFRAIDYSPWGHGGSKNKILAQKIHVLPVSEIFGRAMPNPAAAYA